ncbi:MAG TPA: TIGR00282 family metallophosphoesterase [Gaiellaceae bacterium]|nr:TIGR00282 family metallophosphoesterase [Gaiellaceae bacterium]
MLFIADVVGAPGRGALAARLKTLRAELEIDVCIVNGENAADGIGITPRLADQLLAMGADAITLGNHAFRRAEIGAYLDSSDRVVRPANTSTLTPGRGLAIVTTTNGSRLAVINVLGSLFLHPATSMFELIDGLVEQARAETPLVLVDVHAEATSEKVALARWLDGRVTAVIGTHTHVQTSDATLLPRGTAFITDAGMTGPHDSVIGVESDLAIRRMRTGLPVRFVTAQGDVRIEGALVDCDAETGKASSIEALRFPFP